MYHVPQEIMHKGNKVLYLGINFFDERRLQGMVTVLDLSTMNIIEINLLETSTIFNDGGEIFIGNIPELFSKMFNVGYFGYLNIPAIVLILVCMYQLDKKYNNLNKVETEINTIIKIMDEMGYLDG